MRLRVLVPTKVLLDEQVEQVTAEGLGGEFGLLERHIDFVLPLVPGIVSYRQGEQTQYLGVDRGVLVKVGADVRVVTAQATTQGDLAALERRVAEEFAQLDEQERRAQSAALKLEAGLVRKFLDVQAPGAV
jgi:F-type H+-transporting ATPase subunit epsilon